MNQSIQLVDVVCRRMAMIRLMNVLSVGGRGWSEKRLISLALLATSSPLHRCNLWQLVNLDP